MARSNEFLFSSESVTEGHPDKVCDLIADTVLDECLRQDKHSRVACEVMCKSNQVILGGEITTGAKLNFEKLVRDTIEKIGYTDPSESFNAAGVSVQIHLTRQSADIAQGVDRSDPDQQGAGDQGIMFGYATDETPELMPLPILLAHKLSRALAEARRGDGPKWLRPDAKTQVTVLYRDGRPVEVQSVLVSTQHAHGTKQKEIRSWVADQFAPQVLGDWVHGKIEYLVNPTGAFEIGGPTADAGVTGRKIIVDTYGGFARHGGGAFSGKDPSKVDRSSAYFCRYVARQLVRNKLARRAEIQVAYAIGRAQPMSVLVETFGTGDPDKAAAFVREKFDFRPHAIIERLKLLQPLYTRTTNYGHFGKPGLPWEK